MTAQFPGPAEPTPGLAGLNGVRPRAARCGRSRLTPAAAPALTGTCPGENLARQLISHLWPVPPRSRMGVVDELVQLLEAIRARASDPERQSDMAPWSPLPAPATAGELAAAESRLGFPVPPVIRRVYADVANGGFGPGHGLAGIARARPPLPPPPPA